jgi:uncharacterized protein
MSRRVRTVRRPLEARPRPGPSGVQPLPASLSAVRRLAISRQLLGGAPRRRATTEAILSVVRDLAFVQWDPVSVVAPSHLLSFWARLDGFRPSSLERLLWHERRLLLLWIPMASIVLADDYPLYYSLMRRYPESLSHSWGSQRAQAREFLATHRKLRRQLLRELRRGPRTAGQLGEDARTRRDDGDWAPSSDADEMLGHLVMAGEAMVVGHEGNQNLWGLSEEFLPRRAERRLLPEEEVARAAAQRALRALGTAAPREITFYFVRGRYHDLGATLSRLEEEGTVRRIRVEGLAGRDERYVLAEDVGQLQSIEQRDWEPRVSLLPPFDTLIGNTARTARLFGFEYVREQFLPREKRRFGTYVLPIVWGERLIGRLDAALDKRRRTLAIPSVHAEPDAPKGREVSEAIAEAVERLGEFVGAAEVSYGPQVPPGWRRSLR